MSIELTNTRNMSLQMTAIIVDDEMHARENLRMLVDEFCPNVSVSGLAENPQKASQLIEELSPDLVFLDIMMPGKNGFAFLADHPERKFEVIFTTAHNEHALQAIKEGALHYLEKPINVDELSEAIERAGKRFHQNRSETEHDKNDFSLLFERLKPGGNKTPISTSDGIEFVNNDEIIHLEAQDQYTSIHLTGDRRMMSSKNIKHFEDKLNPEHFFRIHRSHIVNVTHHLKSYSRVDGGVVILSNGIEIPISRRKLPLFMDRIQSL